MNKYTYEVNPVKRKKSFDLIIADHLMNMLLNNQIDDAIEYVKNDKASILMPFKDKLSNESEDNYIINFLYFTNQHEELIRLLKADSIFNNLEKTLKSNPHFLSDMNAIFNDVLNKDDLELFDSLLTSCHLKKKYPEIICKYFAQKDMVGFKKNTNTKYFGEQKISISILDTIETNPNLIVFMMSNIKDTMELYQAYPGSDWEKEHKVNSFMEYRNILEGIGDYFNRYNTSEIMELKTILNKNKLEDELSTKTKDSVSIRPKL